MEQNFWTRASDVLLYQNLDTGSQVDSGAKSVDRRVNRGVAASICAAFSNPKDPAELPVGSTLLFLIMKNEDG